LIKSAVLGKQRVEQDFSLGTLHNGSF
ncbi:MAG: hypothetical protein RL748_1090, partial [Pseudomonadota bacterium]